MKKHSAAAFACGLSICLLVMAAARSATPPPVTDPCEGLVRCASGGPFIAQVLSLVTQGGPKDRHHVLKLQVRFLNITTQPIILGYKSNSSSATDNLGNGYVFGRPGAHDTSFAGIGLVTSRQADPSFVLNPGESRNATFTVTRFNSLRQELGTAWAYDVVINQLEILPSKQIRTGAEYSLHFSDLAPGMPAAPATAAAAANLEQAVENLKSLFKKKK